ncbi:MAG: hypothetical protein J5993_00925 [Clostridia bacterium]|nr:hypothetical protein [Clostridia bacterium]
MKFVAWLDSLKWGWRLFFAFPVLDGIVYSAYRIAKGGWKNVVLGVAWIPFGALIGWFPDMMHIASGKNVVCFQHEEKPNGYGRNRKIR